MMNMSITGLTNKLNDQLGLIEGYNNYTIKALARMTNGGILLEMSNEEGAAWVKNRSREIEGAIGGGAKIKKHMYPIIIKFVPITLDPESTEEREAIKEASDLSRGAITSLRWIKPIEDQRKRQRVGHLIAKFSNENDANKVTTMRLYIHHTRVMAEKQGREPMRCYRCQGYGHVATACMKPEQCARCGEDHPSKGCTNPPCCIPCGLIGHPSYSRKCAIFQKMCMEMNTWLPENTMPYYPMSEKWTHWGAPEGAIPYGKQQPQSMSQLAGQLTFRQLGGRRTPGG
ncbi:hypothetical protein J132_08855 [Termitomyces sp. J132]|nr:hypothetical protein J132_08855 [Termitomyces sp. J132]